MDKTNHFIAAFDYRPALAAQRTEVLAAIAEVLDSGTLILGKQVTAFETEFAGFVGSQHAIGAASGTDALILAFRALDVGQGDEVITVANGPVPTIAAIRAVGASPRFVDVDSIDLQMDPQCIEQAISPATKCVVPIHLYGHPAPVKAISEICHRHGLMLIEDCAQAHGTQVDGRHAGVQGAIGCFSFYPTKNLGAFGDGGLCVTDDHRLAARMRQLRCYGFENDRIAHIEGMNSRLDELQAACLRVQLRHLPSMLEQRRDIATTYLERLQGTGVRLPRRPDNGVAAWHQFVVRVSRREEWLRWFADHRIGVGLHYADPVHTMPAYLPFAPALGSLPLTEKACGEVMSLPIYPGLRAVELQRVADTMIAGVQSGLD